MKSYFKKVVIAGAVALAMSSVAHATVITFEGGLDPTFTYSGISVLNGTGLPALSGYRTVANATGDSKVAFNPSEVSPSDFFLAGPSTGTFTLNSFVIAGAWGSQTLKIQGFNNGGLLFTSSLFVTNSTATTFSPSWSGIDQLRISTGNDFALTSNLGGSGQHWAIDHLTINQAAPVPEPETYAMMLAGLGLLGAAARRRKQGTTAIV